MNRSPESDRSDPGPESAAETRRPGDVDQMVFSFLTELNTLSNHLGPKRGNPGERTEVVLTASDPPNPISVPQAAPKPASYRNIDVLLMDNKQFHDDKDQDREQLQQALPGFLESRPPVRTARKMRHAIHVLIRAAARIALLGTLVFLIYRWTKPFIDNEDISALSHTSSSTGSSVSSASLPKAEAKAIPLKPVLPAVVLERVPPRYPAEARRLGVKGTVELDTEVDAQGRVVRALAVSGPPLLRPAAAEALMKWRFKPAQQDGINVKSTTRVSVVFDR